MKKYLYTLLALPAAFLCAQSSTDLTPMQVTDSPLVISPSGGLDTSLAAFLRYEPGVQVIPQGLAGGSADLSIRGSAFSGAGLSFGGIALRNPQTEHFHADFPFPAHWLAAADVRVGVSQAAGGEGHLAGTVALTPLAIQNRRALSAGVDQEGGFNVVGSLQHTQQTRDGNQFGMGFFGGQLDAPKVDTQNNDVESTRGGAQLQYLSEAGQADLWLGYQEKTFGTTGYYGVNPGFTSEERTRDSLLLASWQSFDPQNPLQVGFMIREFKDDYRLDLPSGLFRNQHTSNVRALQVGTRHSLNEFFGITGRIAVDQEEIRSNNLGNFDRDRLALTLLPDLLLLPGLRLYAGARYEALDGDSDQLLPQARLEWTIAPALLAYVEYSESARRPSYTELNYESPGSLGNSGLDVQTQESLETGLHWKPSSHTTAALALFRHKTRDTVDWIRPDADAVRWQAENIGTVTTLGLEAMLRRQLTEDVGMMAALTLLDKDADEAPYASRYALDYAEQTVLLLLDWQANAWLRVEGSQSFRNQVGNALRTRGGDTQYLTGLALHARPESMPNVQFSLSGTNLLDDNYRVFAGQDTLAERRLAASVSLEW